jgi:cytochrome c-type biogenesis protein CcmH/NrfG
MAEQLDERGEPERTTHGANRTRFSARETRQAGMGVRVFLVLAASLFLALLAWAFVEWSQPDASQTGSVEPSQQAPMEKPRSTEQLPSTESPQGTVPTDRTPTRQSGSGAPREN